MVGGLFLLGGTLIALILFGIAIYIFIKTIQKPPPAYPGDDETEMAKGSFVADQDFDKRYKEYNTKRIINFTIVLVLLYAVISFFYKACTITFD